MIPSGYRVVVEQRLTEADIQDVSTLVRDVTEADEVSPLSEHVWLHIQHGGDDEGHHILVRDVASNALAGYAHLDTTDAVAGASAEVAVAPHSRRLGIGRFLVEELIALSPDGRLRLWAHGRLESSRLLAANLGFSRGRELWQMRRSLLAPLPKLELPEGIALRPFQPGIDDEAWIDLNARAFADLPDQGSWTLVDLRRRMAEPWFSPAGFLVADRDGRMVGFHWTKVHGGHGHGHHHDHAPIGEVYVVGVDPDLRGQGLGRAVTIAGLHYLRGLGLSHVMLYVDASNKAAIALYSDLGLSHWDTDTLYQRSSD